MARRLYIAAFCTMTLLPLVGCGKSDAGAFSLEELARVSVEALKTGDFSICEPFLFTSEDLAWLVTAMEGGESRHAKRVVETHAKDGSQAMLKEIRSRVHTSFDALRAELIEEKIDGTMIEFDRLHNPQKKTVDGIEVGRAYIRIRIGGKTGEIKLEGCFHSPRGWLLGEGWKS